jgi:hypothetical protein
MEQKAWARCGSDDGFRASSFSSPAVSGLLVPTVCGKRIAAKPAKLGPLDVGVERADHDAQVEIANQAYVVAVAEQCDGVLDAASFSTAKDARFDDRPFDDLTEKIAAQITVEIVDRYDWLSSHQLFHRRSELRLFTTPFVVGRRHANPMASHVINPVNCAVATAAIMTRIRSTVVMARRCKGIFTGWLGHCRRMGKARLWRSRSCFGADRKGKSSCR